MSLEMLRFSAGDAHDHAQDVRVQIEHVDADSLADLIGSGPHPSVFVARQSELRALWRKSGRERGRSKIRSQHPDKGLALYFVGDEPVALAGKYSDAARLRFSLGKFLSRGGDHRGVYFLGVEDALFEDVLEQSTPAESRSDPEDYLARFTGDSPEAVQVRWVIRSVATAPELRDESVLIQGPSGAGKEVAARAIHELGRGAAGGAWVAVNCAAFPANLIEAELFGVAPNTATGVAGRPGLWETASKEGGTLFLNEIGELPLEQQPKLLRALEENEIRRVGGDREIPVSARVIADTNRDLYAMIADGSFREDLYYRLTQGVVIHIPGLDERGGDLKRMAQDYWCEITGSPDARLSEEILALLQSRTWPGGPRQLRGTLVDTYLSSRRDKNPGPDALLKALRARPDGAPSRVAHPEAPDDPEDDGPGPGAGSGRSGRLVSAFKSIRPVYARLAEVLRKLLERAVREVAPLAIVQVRAKSVSSFAEKLLRNPRESGDPFGGIRDLCGARVIVHTEDQLRRLASLVERYFEVDPQRSTPAERGGSALRSDYTPVARVVRLDRARADALARHLGVVVPDEALGLWAEIQLRTVLEHAWLHVNREMGRRLPLRLPDRWRDQLDELAGLLKTVDRSFERIRGSFDAYRTSYPTYLEREDLEREVSLLQDVLECENDPEVAVRLGKLVIALGDFDRAIELLSAPAAAGFQPAMRDLGVALCQKDRERPESALYRRGQDLLEQACAEPHRDPDALCSLAGSWKRRGREDLALTYYRRAYELDPADPYALGGALESELVLHREVDIVAALGPSIRAAIGRCRDHIDAGVNLPWALYDLGKFQLLRGEIEPGLDALREAVEHSTAPFMLATSLESFERIGAATSGALPGMEEGRVLLARAARDFRPVSERPDDAGSDA